MRYQAKKQKTKFFHITVIYTIILLLAAMTILTLLWNSLSSYESSTPKFALRPVVAALEQGDYAQVMTVCGIETADFFDEEQYVSYMKGILGEPGKTLTVREISSSDPGVKTFDVSANEKKGVRFYLREEGDSYRISQAEIPTREYVIYAPGFVTVLVNGTALIGTESASKPISSFRGLDDTLAPRMAEYRVKGFIEEPDIRLADISASDSQKEILSDDSILFTVFAAEDERAFLEKTALNAAQVYARFVCTDAERSELKRLILPDTPFEDVVDNFSNYWYIEHESYGFENIKTENILKYSPDHFTAEVSFDYTIQKGNIHRVYPAHYRLAFLNRNGKYWLVNLELL